MSPYVGNGQYSSSTSISSSSAGALNSPIAVNTSSLTKIALSLTSLIVSDFAIASESFL